MASTTSATTKDFSLLSDEQRDQYPFAERLLNQLLHLNIHTAKMDTLDVKSNSWQAHHSLQQATLKSCMDLTDKVFEQHPMTVPDGWSPLDEYFGPNQQFQIASGALASAANMVSFITTSFEDKSYPDQVMNHLVSMHSWLLSIPPVTANDVRLVDGDQDEYFWDAIEKTGLAAFQWQRASQESDRLDQILRMADTVIALEELGLQPEAVGGKGEAPESTHSWCTPTFPTDCQGFFDIVKELDLKRSRVPQPTVEEARSLLKNKFLTVAKEDFWRNRPQADLSVLTQASSRKEHEEDTVVPPTGI